MRRASRIVPNEPSCHLAWVSARPCGLATQRQVLSVATRHSIAERRQRSPCAAPSRDRRPLRTSPCMPTCLAVRRVVLGPPGRDGGEFCSFLPVSGLFGHLDCWLAELRLQLHSLPAEGAAGAAAHRTAGLVNPRWFRATARAALTPCGSSRCRRAASRSRPGAPHTRE